MIIIYPAGGPAHFLSFLTLQTFLCVRPNFPYKNHYTGKIDHSNGPYIMAGRILALTRLCTENVSYTKSKIAQKRLVITQAKHNIHCV